MNGLLASNDDLISAYGSSSVSATQHYVSNGYAEGRSIDTFDEWSYLASNEDLISAFAMDQALFLQPNIMSLKAIRREEV